MLVTNSFTPNVDTTNFKSNVTGEASGSGYTAGGVTVTATASVDNATDKGVLTIGAASFGTITVSNVRYYIYYFDSGTASTSEIIDIVDLGSDGVQSVTNTAFSVQSTTISLA